MLTEDEIDDLYYGTPFTAQVKAVTLDAGGLPLYTILEQDIDAATGYLTDARPGRFGTARERNNALVPVGLYVSAQFRGVSGADLIWEFDSCCGGGGSCTSDCGCECYEGFEVDGQKLLWVNGGEWDAVDLAGQTGMLVVTGGVLGLADLPETTTQGIWRYDTSTTMSAPASGKVRSNNAAWASATQIALASVSDGGVDESTFLRSLLAGDAFNLQDKANSANHVRYTLSANPTDNGTWFLLPVTFVAAGGSTPTNNSQLLLTFSQTGGGPGGGGGTVTSITLTQPAAGLTITGSGTAITSTGTPTFALADDLAALEALTGTSTIYYRSGTSAWTAVTIAPNLTFLSGTLSIQNAAVANSLLSHMTDSTIKGRSVGAGTGDPQDLSGTQATAILPNFGPAGFSHARGVVPDPGATTHGDYPAYHLRDSAAWEPALGMMVGTPSNVSTDETTTSGTAVELTTTQQITFTLNATSNIYITGAVNYYNSTAANAGGISVDVDGTNYQFTTGTPPAANGAIPLNGAVLVSLGTGSHTLKLMFSTAAGSTAHFRWRSIAAWITP